LLGGFVGQAMPAYRGRGDEGGGHAGAGGGVQGYDAAE
jgi:hypothetical protein